MRNLKKVLSLSLALVMLLGMMIVGAGAADTGFKDDASISESFKEAAAVNKALGLMTGDGSNLNPTANITRAEAFILSLRVDGSNANEIASKWPVSEKPFNDVTTGKWYAPYLAYGKEMGYISGSGGNYNPDGNITVVEYSILLLGKLGFDPARYTGAGWNTNAAADAQAAGLYDGLGSVNYYNHQLTRQEACQMVFNALFYSPSGSNGYVIGGSDLVYPSLLEAVLAKSVDESLTGAISEAPAADTLAKKVFKLESGKGDDGFGREVKTWKVDGEVVYTGDTSTTAAKKTFSFQSIKDSDLKGLTYATEITKIVDGKEIEEKITGEDSAKVEAIKGLAENNNVVELYASDGKKIDKVIVVNTYAGVVSVTEANEKKETKRSIKIDGDSTVNALETEDFEKGQIVLYNKSVVKDDAGKDTEKYTIKNVAAADFVSGKLTRVSSDNKFTVSGTVYGKSAGMVSGHDEESIKDGFLGEDDMLFYLDAAGKNIVAAAAPDGEVVTVKDYAMVLDADVATTTSFGTESYKLTVKALLSDGTIGNYEVVTKKVTQAMVDADETLTKGDWIVDGANEAFLTAGSAAENDTERSTAALTALENTVFTYTLKDGKMTLKAALASVQGDTEDGTYASAIVNSTEETANKIVKGSSTVKVGTGTQVVLNSKTAFVLTANKKTATSLTGTANLSGTEIKTTEGDETKYAFVVMEMKDTLPMATCVFVVGIGVSADETGSYVYVDGKYEEGVDENGDPVYYYTGITPDGDEIEVTGVPKAVDDERGIPTTGGVYTYDTDMYLGDEASAPEGKGEGTVTVVSGGVAGIKAEGVESAEYFTVNDDTKVVSVDGKTDLEEDAIVIYVAKDEVLLTVYVTGEAEAPAEEEEEEEEKEEQKTDAGEIPDGVSYSSGTKLVKGKEGDNEGEVTATLEITLKDGAVEATGVTANVEEEHQSAVTVSRGSIERKRQIPAKTRPRCQDCLASRSIQR